MAGSIIVYKKPEIIAKFYLDAARELRSFPKKVKADDGTEQAIVQPIHILLRDSVGYNNSVKSFSIFYFHRHTISGSEHIGRNFGRTE